MGRGDFFQEQFLMGEGANLCGGLLYIGGLMIRSCHGWGGGGSKNATYSNLDTVNMKLFPNHGKIFSWR